MKITLKHPMKLLGNLWPAGTTVRAASPVEIKQVFPGMERNDLSQQVAVRFPGVPHATIVHRQQLLLSGILLLLSAACCFGQTSGNVITGYQVLSLFGKTNSTHTNDLIALSIRQGTASERPKGILVNDFSNSLFSSFGPAVTAVTTQMLNVLANTNNYIQKLSGKATNTLLIDSTRYFSNRVREPFWSLTPGLNGSATNTVIDGPGSSRQVFVDGTGLRIYELRHNDFDAANSIIYIGAEGPDLSPGSVTTNWSDGISLRVYGPANTSLPTTPWNPRITFVMGDDANTWRWRALQLEDAGGNQMLTYDNDGSGNLWVGAMGTRRIDVVTPGAIGANSIGIRVNGTNYNFTAGTQFSTNGSAAVVATNIFRAISNVFISHFVLSFTNYDSYSWVLPSVSGTNIYLTPWDGGHTIDVTNNTGITYVRGGDPVVSLPRLYLSDTTNLVTFGQTNTPPVTPGTVSKWISVKVNGEGTAYRIPLYQ